MQQDEGMAPSEELSEIVTLDFINESNMVPITIVSSQVKQVVQQWISEATSLAELESLFCQPDVLADTLYSKLPSSFDSTVIHDALNQNSYIKFQDMFDIDISDEEESPNAFHPVPSSVTTITARATAILLHKIINLNTISYGTENDGALFVNLVVMPEGSFATKSTAEMKGHTDAVSFPALGDSDQEDERIAPSPDAVTLIGLRNPTGTATRIIPVKKILKNLDNDHIKELKKPVFIFQAQQTFRSGMEGIWGRGSFHTVYNGCILSERSDGQMWIRFSHSNTDVDDDDSPSKPAMDALVSECAKNGEDVVIAPGDIVIIHNRRALHGRAQIQTSNSKSRWLLRTYGLDKEKATQVQRNAAIGHKMFP